MLSVSCLEKMRLSFVKQLQDLVRDVDARTHPRRLGQYRVELSCSAICSMILYAFWAITALHFKYSRNR
jgi:hypothetical protein